MPMKGRSRAGSDRASRPGAEFEAPMKEGKRSLSEESNCWRQEAERGKCHHEGSERIFQRDETTAIISMETEHRAFLR